MFEELAAMAKVHEGPALGSSGREEEPAESFGRGEPLSEDDGVEHTPDDVCGEVECTVDIEREGENTVLGMCVVFGEIQRPHCFHRRQCWVGGNAG